MSLRKRLTVFGALAAITALLLNAGVADMSLAAPAATQPDAIAVTIRSAHLAEPLVRTADTTRAEDQALAEAITRYERRTQPEDISSLTAFAARYPHSGWSSAVLTNVGLSYLHDGYFSRAIDAFSKAWMQGRAATDPHAKAMVDRAVGELARLYGSFGQFDKLSALFDDIGKRPISGSATEAIQGARENLGLVGRDEVHLFNCGPIALKLLMLALAPHDQAGSFLQWYKSGSKGTNLAELGGLADKAKFSYRIVSRTPGQPVPYPALVHWKVGHFATIDAKANGRYHVQDPVFPGDGLWVTQAALDAEASGYFLVPASAPAGAGW